MNLYSDNDKIHANLEIMIRFKPDGATLIFHRVIFLVLIVRRYFETEPNPSLLGGHPKARNFTENISSYVTSRMRGKKWTVTGNKAESMQLAEREARMGSGRAAGAWSANAPVFPRLPTLSTITKIK